MEAVRDSPRGAWLLGAPRSRIPTIAAAVSLSGCIWTFPASELPASPSPAVAATLGVIPSFGMGHRYAGDRKAANILLLTEFVGVGLILSGPHTPLAIAPSPEGADGKLPFTEQAGVALVLGSILFDTIHSPIVAERRRHGTARWRIAPWPAGCALARSF